MELSYALWALRLNIEGFNGHNNDINFGFVYPLLSDFKHSHLFFYGKPEALPNYFSIATAFPTQLWILVFIVTLTFIVLFCIILKVYRDALGQHQLVRNGTKGIDVAFKVISTLTEPETFDMFPVWSTGMKKLILKDVGKYPEISHDIQGSSC